jgi:hypothetical protein
MASPTAGRKRRLLRQRRRVAAKRSISEVASVSSVQLQPLYPVENYSLEFKCK